MSGNGYGVDEYGVGVYGLLGVPGGDVIVLDPPEVAEGRIPLTLTSGEIRVADEGPDWGEAALEAFQAELEVGSVPIDVRWPNRQIRIPLLLGAVGPGFEAARAQLQQKVGLFQKEGGWVRRNNLFADVVNASLVMPDKWGHRELEPDVILVLEAIPDFYGPETELPVHVGVAPNPTLIFLENGIPGDMPGRVTIAVTEFNNRLRRGLVWGWRSRHYSGTDTAQLRYRAQDMTPLDTAVVTALTGSASGQVVRHSGVGQFAAPIVGTDIADGPLTHTGSYRVWARVHSSSGLALFPDRVHVRFVWDVGDYTSPSENEPWSFPGRNNFYIADLGEIHLEAAPIGEHRWAGQVQAWCSLGGLADVSVDELWFQPTGEGAGVLRAPAAESQGAFTVFSARGLSGPSETSGALHGKTMTIGGNWATSGDATDFTVVNDGTGAYAYRTVNTDASDVGRLALAGTGTDDQLTNQILFSWDPTTDGPGSPVTMLYQRWTDDTHNVHARVYRASSGGGGLVHVFKRNGGASVELGRALLPFPIADDTQYVLRLATDTIGAVFVWVSPWPGQVGGAPSLVAFDSDLAGGNALATGQHGLREYYNAPSPAVIVRYHSWYAAWPGLSDAVLFPNRSLQIRTDGVFREGTDATRYGPVEDVEGPLPRIPNAGLEGRPTELFLKASRGDFRSLPDSGVDNMVASLKVRPSFIFPR